MALEEIAKNGGGERGIVDHHYDIQCIIPNTCNVRGLMHVKL